MRALTFSARGDCRTLTAATRAALVDRGGRFDDVVRDRAAAIVARVRREGDPALRSLALEHDGVAIDTLEVSRDECEQALAGLEAPVRAALRRAAANIRAVHEAFRPSAQQFTTADGVVVGRRPDPLARIGVYAPGGRAAYPSSLLMGAVPARAAGVGEVIACSPPGADGRPASVVMAAAAIAQVDRLFAVGGAGAIAAMAYGTASIPRVDRLVGPGNSYVAAAKALVAGDVGIDSPAGPSELLVIADATARADVIAREMLAQAEHDATAAVVLVATSGALVAAVDAELCARLAAEPRAETIRAAFRTNGAMLLAPTLADAVAFANEWAAEHVLLAVEEGAVTDVLAALRNAGSVFLGESSSVAFGDYLTGSNHVLPTGGRARTHSGLSTSDFVRWTSWQRVPLASAAALAADTSALATAEGLPAHASAARAWGAR